MAFFESGFSIGLIVLTILSLIFGYRMSRKLTRMATEGLDEGEE
jgi:purine-cytosine permease-like protein